MVKWPTQVYQNSAPTHVVPFSAKADGIQSRKTAMRVFDFDHAIVRHPGRSVVNGIRSDVNSTPGFDGIVREHRTYVAALREAGMTVDALRPLEAYPDSIFVEDAAIVLPEGAILLRPGAPARLGESEEMRGALQQRFAVMLELKDDEHADGGDVLVTPDVIFIGMSKRTNRKGAQALREKLHALGRAARIVETPSSILHFKTDVALLSEETIVATQPMADSGLFADFKILPIPAGEEAAANLLRVNDSVFVGDCFPRTIELIAKDGMKVVALPVSEIGKLDAGLSCMSLRWRKPQ
jgi:dimethylargininase